MQIDNVLLLHLNKLKFILMHLHLHQLSIYQSIYTSFLRQTEGAKTV